MFSILPSYNSQLQICEHAYIHVHNMIHGQPNILLLICTGTKDFDIGPHIVEFSINSTMVSFNVPIFAERILEIDENFMLSVDQTLLIPQVFLRNISQAIALIIDDDRKCNS